MYESGVKISITDLRAKLGSAAFHTWEALLLSSDKNGYSHATLAGIAKQRGLTTYNVKRALRLLREAALVRDLGWKKLMVRCGRGTTARDVYVRRIYGHRSIASAIIPLETDEWLLTRKQHGGKRAGAGRKAALVVENPNQVYPRGANSSVSPEYLASAFASSFGSLQTPSEVRTPTSSTPSMIKKQDLGSALVGHTSQRSPGEPGAFASVPRYPGFNVIEPAYIPTPPLLDANLSEAEACAVLTRCFRGAVASRFDTRIPAHVLMKPKYRHALIAACDKLIEHDIPPAAWAAFSVDVWKTYGTQHKAPALLWVWSAKRIEERREWFNHSNELNHYGAQRAVFTKPHLALLRRYARMRAELTATCANTRDAVDAIVSRHFPGNMYAELLERARRESKLEQERLNAAAADGDFLW